MSSDTPHHVRGKDMTTEEFRDYLRDKMEEMVGLRDLERANQRAAALHQWRDDQR